MQHENVDFIDAKEHERLVNIARSKGPDFTKPLRLLKLQEKRQRAAAARKRIYGEEYRTLAQFNVEPKFKMVKLDRHQYELLATNATTNSTAPSDDVEVKRYANPTPTVRQSSVFNLTAAQIPKICMECLYVRCNCEV